MKVISTRSSDIVSIALGVLRRGGVVVFPTETAYGLGGDWTKRSIHERVRKIKARPHDKPFPVIVSSMAMAKRYVWFNAVARRVAREHWPGPLSLVLPLQTHPVPRGGTPLSRGEFHSPLLRRGEGVGSLSLRISPHPVALQLVRGLGRPLIATSANVSGSETLYDARDVIAEFKGRKHQPDLVIDAGRLPKRLPSTIVAVKEDGSFEVLREGPIRITELRSVIPA